MTQLFFGARGERSRDGFVLNMGASRDLRKFSHFLPTTLKRRRRSRVSYMLLKICEAICQAVAMQHFKGKMIQKKQKNRCIYNGTLLLIELKSNTTHGIEVRILTRDVIRKKL
jgi:hypothetical protein